VLPVEQTNGTPRAAAKYTGLDFVPLLWETSVEANEVIK
jgi:hypothetical protein